MKTCDCINQFYSKKDGLSDKAQLLWFRLFSMGLKCGSWTIQADNASLMSAVGIKERDSRLKQIRNELVEKGLLTIVSPGKKGCPTVYELILKDENVKEPAVVVRTEVIEEKVMEGPVKEEPGETAPVADTETALVLVPDAIKPDKEVQKRTRLRLRGEMKRYGRHGNVLLTDEGLRQLQQMCPGDWAKWIERVDDYCTQHKVKPYKDVVATVQAWMRRDKNKNKTNVQNEVQTGIRNALAAFAQTTENNTTNVGVNKLFVDENQEVLF